MKPPNNGKGARAGADSEHYFDTDAWKLSQRLRRINPPFQWGPQGWAMLNLYLETGNRRHLDACRVHVAGIEQRMRNRKSVHLK